MRHQHGRREVGLAILLMVCLGVGCAHTREVFYPRVPRRAARVRLMPRARTPASGGVVRGRAVPKSRPFVEVE